jgi:hypothetical protein
MKLLAGVLLAVRPLTPVGLAQTGTVTFYSAALPTKDALKTLAVPAGNMPFRGWLFDGEEKLAHARIGRFMTFHLTPGPHLFSATYGASQPGSATALINIQADHHYCVRLSARYESYYVVPLSSVAGRIDQVPCQQVFQEAGTTKPLEAKRVEPAARLESDSSASFPKEN